ncbi:MAG: hypothetical protein AB7R89_03445 [Dehalococcoidia bacterium]
MNDTTQQFIAQSGHIGGYDVFLHGDTVTVLDDEGIVTRQTVDGLGAFITRAKSLRTGWGQFPDGMEVIYLYNRGDDNYGYAINLQAEHLSEWGYAPF